ncbi:MAG TPA: ATP-binding protein [Desulfuromonadales bacterium]
MNELSATAETAVDSLPQTAMAAGKILIVEDEVELAEVLEYNLRRSGFAVLTAHDGLSACRLVGAERPDLILLDLLLPDLDGWEICRLIRGHHDAELASTPIVMMTALGSLDDRLRGLELGADAYLAKPYSVKEVALCARNLLVRRRERRALADGVAALKAGAALESDFQDMLFHELRNQLLIIGGYSGLLAKGDPSLPPGECLQAIRRSAIHLDSLAEGILLCRRIEAGVFRLPLEKLNLDGVAAETIELFRPLAAAKRITVRLSAATSSPLALNRTATRLVISSLLENAIKYSEEGKTVELRLHETADGVATLAVEDRGPGIPAAEIDRIFERFYRGEGSDGRTRGSGLGLYICRTLTRAMGGSVEVKSVPGEGSCFSVRFPARPARSWA